MRRLTGRSSGRQHGPWLRHCPGPCWCPSVAALLAAPLTLGVRPSLMKGLREAFPTPSELSVLRRPANYRAARPPIGARHRSGSGNAITERVHHIYPGSSVLPQNTSQGLLHSPHRASACSLTGWSSGHQYLLANIGSLRASHSGAAYLGR